MTIRKKLSFGIGIILAFFLALGIVSYFHIGKIDDNLSRIMQGKELGMHSVILYQRYKSLDEETTNKKNNQDALFALVSENVENINGIIDETIQTEIESIVLNENKKILEISKMKTDVAEIPTWLGTYLKIPKEDYKNRIFDAINTFEQELGRFKKNNPTEEEKNFTTELETAFNQTISIIKEIISLNEQLQESDSKLKEMRAKINDLLYEEFKVFTRADIERTKEASRKIVGSVVVVALILILTGFLYVFVFGAAITRSIAKSIIQLRDTVAEIGKGDFDAKIEIESSDEIGQLASSSQKIAGDLKSASESIKSLKKEVNKHKMVEEELKKLNARLESANYELQNTNKELKEFAYVAAHDLKTPLRSIGVLANWISTDYADKFDQKGKEQIKLLVGRAERMSKLIDNLLEYSKTGQPSQKKQVDLNIVLSEVISEIKSPANIEISIENEMPTVISDKTRMRRVFANLLNNAVQCVDKPKGQIKIASVREDGFWKFSVSDNGPGIDPKYHEKIFKICQTLSPHDDIEGTGIGLSIVKKIVENNGGTIWLESEVGKGSTFYFTIPRSDVRMN
jgi:signal transduction histidine kinase